MANFGVQQMQMIQEPTLERKGIGDIVKNGVIQILVNGVDP